MKALIIFALISLIFSQNSNDIRYYIVYECPDDKKIKIGDDVCAIVSREKGTKTTPSKVYIKKKSCGKNKVCDFYNDFMTKDTIFTEYGPLKEDVYSCRKKVRLLKINKKCNYNVECYTSYCNNGKCATFDACTSETGRNICGPGKYCKYYNTIGSKSSGTCTDYLKEGAEVGSGESCAPGLGEYTDPDENKVICKKLYSLDIGAKSSEPEFCKSYFSDGTQCVELTKVDSTCSITYNDGKTDTTIDASKDSSLYKEIDGKKYCLYSTGKKELVNELVKRYNEIKLDKPLEKEACDYEKYFCDKKYAELKEVYDNYDTLKYLDLINDNGEKNKDKKCEYEFWRTWYVSSSYVNVCFGFIFTLLGFLF